MPHHKPTQKAKAQYLYLTTSHTQKAIAAALGISERGMRKWVKQGNWAELKKATFHSPDQETQHLYEELREINDTIDKRPAGQRFGTKAELEAKAKILALIMGPLKNAADNWRNIAPEHFIEECPAKTPNSGPILFDVIVQGGGEQPIHLKDGKPIDPAAMADELFGRGTKKVR